MNSKYIMHHLRIQLLTFFSLLFLILLAANISVADEQEPLPASKTIIVANGGGEGALANTLPGIALASTVGFDFLELPLVVTGDSSVIIHPSVTLDPSTDVAEHFADRVRDDGHFYVTDFTLAEIRQLRKKTDQNVPFAQPALGIPTLAETLALLTVIDQNQQKRTKLALLLISPSFHADNHQDISDLTLLVLRKSGYATTDNPVLLQCADGDELQRIHEELLPALGLSFPLMQRIEQSAAYSDEALFPQPYDHSWMFTRLGLRVVSSYADILALHTSYLQEKTLTPTYLEDARSLGLQIFTFPLMEKTVTALPPSENQHLSLGARLDHYLTTLALDGVISAAPKATLTYLAQQKEAQIREKEKEKNRSILNINLQPLSLEERSKNRVLLHSSSTP